MGDSRGAVEAPNIWRHPAVYELENRGSDPRGELAAALEDRVDLTGRHVVDLGCGSGFHLPWLAERAAQVTGVEPHPGLVAAARRRTAALDAVQVIEGTAQHLPLAPGSVDVMHARLAYFFGPGCEAGLREVNRILRPGGEMIVIDNDLSRSTWATWFRRGFPHLPTPSTIERFWSTHGFARTSIDMDWQFETRRDFEAVVRIELPAPVAEQLLAHHPGTGIDYAVNLWHKRF